MIIGEYELKNDEKVNRVIMGTQANDGSMRGGLGEDAAPEAILAAYDKLGGLIVKGNDRVKTGSFYDFKAKAPRSKPEVSFVYRVNGVEVEVKDGVELPGVVKAARQLEAAQAEEVEIEVPKKRKK